MPKLTERVKAAYKAFWGSGNWIDSNHSRGISRGFVPGTNIDYANLTGDIRTNSIVQACINKIMLAWPESYPCVKEESGEKKVIATNHPLMPILRTPNPAYDDTVLWGGTIADFFPKGNAYWGINRDRIGEVREFVYLPAHTISPMRNNNSKSIGPDFYEWQNNGTAYKMPVEDIVHYRFGVDRTNDLLGMAFPASAIREVYTDNESSNYINSSLKNRGAAWLVASPKNPDGYFNDPTAIKDKIEAHTSGDNRHRALVMDGAVDIVFPPSVKDTGPDELRRTPEARICALFGLPPIWVGMSAGLERSTYSNMEEAAKDAWLTIVAVQRLMGRQLTMQVLRREGNFPAQWLDSKYFAGFDYSEVRALQPNRVEERKSVGELHSTHKLLTKDEAREELGYKPLTPEQMKELEEPEPQPNPQANTVKPKKSAYEELREKIIAESSAHEQTYKRMFGLNPAEDDVESTREEGSSGSGDNSRLVSVGNGTH